MDESAPEWPYWTNTVDVWVHEAVWLSLNVDPRRRGGAKQRLHGDFQLRLSLALSHIDALRLQASRRVGYDLELAGLKAALEHATEKREAAAAIGGRVFLFAHDKLQRAIRAYKDAVASEADEYRVQLATFGAWAESLPAPLPLPEQFPRAVQGAPPSQAMRRGSAVHAANQRHSQPGGYRSKHEQLRAAWASGKYPSRNECAKLECAALGLSQSAARRALIKTPDPSRA